MKKTFIAVLFSVLAVAACKPVQPENNGPDNNKPNIEDPTPLPGTEAEPEMTFYVGETEVAALEFTPEVKSFQLTVAANFQWSLDKSVAWPGWLTKPEGNVDGVKEEESDYYVATFTLALDESVIANFYDSKTGALTFTDLNDLDDVVELPVSHTFEKPEEPESILSNSLGTNILTVGLDGKIKGTDSNTLDITITPGEGQEAFKGFPLARITYPPYGENDLDWAPCIELSNLSTYGPEDWITVSAVEDNKCTLTVGKYPDAYEIPAGSGRMYRTLKALVFVLPSAVYGSWSANAQDPTTAWWWNFNKFQLIDIYGDVLNPGEVYDQYKKYVITINVEQPAE